MLNTVVVTNDDGVTSPFIVPLIEALGQQRICSTVLPVVPATEQSWIADAITRFRDLKTEACAFGEVMGFSVDGTPADCASLAIHNLSDVKPELLISGINMGMNAGLPFFLCSGTVGAATQAALNGVPGIALSCNLPSEVFSLWLSKDHATLNSRYAARYREISNYCVELCAQVLQSGALSEAELFSINVPWEVDERSSIRFAKLARATYRKLFAKENSGRFRHHFTGFDFPDGQAPAARSDLSVLNEGGVSITPIRFDISSEVSDEVKSRIEGRLRKTGM